MISPGSHCRQRLPECMILYFRGWKTLKSSVRQCCCATSPATGCSWLAIFITINSHLHLTCASRTVIPLGSSFPYVLFVIRSSGVICFSRHRTLLAFAGGNNLVHHTSQPRRRVLHRTLSTCFTDTDAPALIHHYTQLYSFCATAHFVCCYPGNFVFRGFGPS